MQSHSKFYHEVTLGDFRDKLCDALAGAWADARVGWLTEEFVEKEIYDSGVGYDEHGWAVSQRNTWHCGCAGGGPSTGNNICRRSQRAWWPEWKHGDVIGCAR